MKKINLCFITYILLLTAATSPAANDQTKPIITPDYTNTVLPYNIAPINFTITEHAEQYKVEISAQNNKININSKTSAIHIPPEKWKALLENNKAAELTINISLKKNNSWQQLPQITNTISDSPIDTFIAYRKIHPTHYLINGVVGLYQRNLTNFKEKTILENKDYGKGSCLNCHTFCNNNTQNMFLSIRSPKHGNSVLMVNDSNAKKIDTKFGYSSFHPSGKIATYSINRLPIFFYSARQEVRDTVDLDSLIVYYDLDKKTVKTVPHLSQKQYLETYPVWSPDGKYLYFCRAKMLWSDKEQLPPENYKMVKYSIERVSYDIETDTWGQIETVIPKTDKSMLLPKISPDGKWLLFCICDFGCFPAWSPSSDLYIADLTQTPINGKYKYQKLNINSDQSEAWHSFSANSRWFVFSSKRDFGTLTRLYISYLDENGNAHKPFVIPQKDPEYYNRCLHAYNLPELISNPIPLSGEQLAKTIRSKNPSKVKMIDIPVTMATKKAYPQSPYSQQE